MATTVGPTPPKAPDLTTSSVGLGIGVNADAANAPAAKAKVTLFGVDALEAQKAALEIKSAKAAKISGPDVPGATVLSEFPIQDLGQITTQGRYAQGFRLDGSSLRLMWLNVRRTQEKDGAAGFEVFFQAQGATIENFKKRLEQAGATAGSYKFHSADVDETDKTKSVLKKSGSDWGPSTQSSLKLEQAGKWTVEMVTDKPEALKGAFRIHVQGNDADATAALQEVIKKLGLQSLFAPPAPNALERFKLLRFMWQVAPGAADHLRFKELSQLAEALPDAINLAEPDPAKLKLVDEAKLDSPEMKERGQLATLLYQKSPQAFLKWAKDAEPLVLSSGGSNSALKSALSTAGIADGSEPMKAALAKEPVLDEVKSLLELGVLAKTNSGAADALILRDLETVKLGELHQALTNVGIDPTSDRVKNLRFEEVYPGYFTVIDPALPEELKAAGARYLYSTSDNAERVWTMLTGGQKASLTRFQEGLIIQGKSSDSDFGTGGASSVFSRLVTDSIIQKAKKDTSTSSYSDTNFNDWGGSRPFKLIINRRALARTDWYGYNADRFGRTTDLKAENHGSAIVKTINGSYSRSNEVMFPVGNDPSYVDFVVAPSEEKKKELVDFLLSKGMTELNGKPVAELVIVRTRFFEHPDDLTLSAAVRDALMTLGFQAEIEAAKGAAKAAAEAALKEQLPAIASNLVTAGAKGTLLQNGDSSATNKVSAEAADALKSNAEALAKLTPASSAGLLQAAALPAAEETLTKTLSEPALYSTWQLDSSIKSLAENGLSTVLEPVIASVIAAQVAALTPTANTPDARQELRKALESALKAELEPLIKARVLEKGTEAGRQKVASMVSSNASFGNLKAAKEAARAAAAAAGQAALDAQVVSEVVSSTAAAITPKATEGLLSMLKSSGSSWLRSSVQAAYSAKAEEIANQVCTEVVLPHALEGTKASAAEAAAKAMQQFSATYPDKSGDDEKAKVPETVTATITELVETATKTLGQNVAGGVASAHLTPAIQAIESGPLYAELAAEMVAARSAAAAQKAVEDVIAGAAQKIADDAVSSVVPKVVEALKSPLADTLVPPALDRAVASILQSQLSSLSYSKINPAVNEIMKKLTTPPSSGT